MFWIGDEGFSLEEGCLLKQLQKERKMRGGKDEKKLMDPLFPRLHINDTGKGGPRAPPRNKMALCEEINSPSQRSSSGSIPMQPLQPSNSSSSVPSASLNHVDCPKKSEIFSFCSLPGSSRMGERFYSYFSGALNFDRKSINPEYRISKSGNCQTFYGQGPFEVTAECKLFRSFGFYTSMHSSSTKLENEDDLRIPYFSQTEIIPSCDAIRPALEKKNLTSSIFSTPGKYQTASERQEKQTRSTDLMSRDHLRNQVDLNSKVSQMREYNAKRSILADAAPNPLARNITSESDTGTLAPTNQTMTSSLVRDLSQFPDPCAQSHQECRSLTENAATIDGISGNPERLSRKTGFSIMEGPSCSSPPSGEDNKILNLLESVNEYPKDNDISSSQVGDAERAMDISNNSVVDSKSGYHISPDDVVGAIGLKLFWKVRRTIAHQQRIFAVQLFELHRLIRVQKTIAGSPEMLYEDKFRCSKPSTKYSPVKKLLSQDIPKPSAVFVRPKCDSKKPNLSSDCAAEDANVKLPPLKPDCKKEHATQNLTLQPYSGALTSGFFASDAKLGPWCRAPTGNQWLVPVKSPSEGLIYKPYAGPCPPTTCCIAPVYGSCGPMDLTRVDADFVNTTYGVPASNQQGNVNYSGPAALDQSCFEPYSLPVIDTSNSNSAVEQAAPFARVQSSKQDNCLSRLNLSYIIPYRSSFNTTSQRSRIISDSGRDFPVFKGSEFHGSSATSPSEGMQGDELPLFPTTPTVQTTHQPVENKNTEQRIQVIKVVPHNPKAACESAARIFRSIQEERKQHE